MNPPNPPTLDKHTPPSSHGSPAGDGRGSADTAVDVSEVTRLYPGRPPVAALDGFDLRVSRGSFAAVIGPSGSGKTTLLRVLAGIERPTSGTVAIDGEVVSDDERHLGPERRPVGLVPQEGALFPHLDVAGNVGFGLNRLDRAKRRRRVSDLLDLVGLPGMERRRPHELSGGQQQRVALARALAPSPAVVLLDEPFSALDASLRASLRDELAGLLRDTGTTAILVTHDQDEALSVADSLTVIRSGRVAQSGPPSALYRRPADLWVAGFLGEAVALPAELIAGPEPVVRGALGSVPAVPGAGVVAGPVTAFCRPEQVWPARDGGEGVEAKVLATRFAGPEVSVDLEVAGTVVTARWPSSLPGTEIGARVRVEVLGPMMAFPVDDTGR